MRVKEISTSEIINKVINSKIKDTYLQIINIGMLLFHKSSRVTTVINNVRLNKELDEESEIINSNNVIVSAIKNDKLYINILDDKNKMLVLENMLIDINYYYNVKYKKINKNLVFDYINVIECEEILKLVSSIIDEIDDKDIMQLFDEMNIKEHCINYSNQLQTNIIRPLYDYFKNKHVKYSNLTQQDKIDEINNLLIDSLEIDDPYKLSENYRIIKNIIKKISSN